MFNKNEHAKLKGFASKAKDADVKALAGKMLPTAEEGEYSAVGGKMFDDTDRELVMQSAVFSRKGTDRILKYAFELAQSRPKKHLTSATKSNGISISMPYWDSRVEAMAPSYADVRWDKYVEPVRRHPVRPRPGLHRHHRHRTVGQP